MALEQWGTISLQACVRVHLARMAVGRMAEATVAIQAGWRGVSGRRVAVSRKISAVRVQSFARGVIVAARYRRALAAATVLEACWRGYVVRARLAMEVEIRGEVQMVTEERSAVTLQAFARGVLTRVRMRGAASAGAVAVILQAHWRSAAVRTRLPAEAKIIPIEASVVREESSAVALPVFGRRVLKRPELWTAARVAAAAQKTWQAKRQKQRSHGVARMAVAAQARGGVVAARAKGRCVRYGNSVRNLFRSVRDHFATCSGLDLAACGRCELRCCDRR